MEKGRLGLRCATPEIDLGYLKGFKIGDKIVGITTKNEIGCGDDRDVFIV